MKFSENWLRQHVPVSATRDIWDRIAPWWDGEGAGATISLPDLGKLKKVKPSVSFAMPPGIANLLNGDAKDLSEGKGPTAGPNIAWICSFSIPYITLCAFIVLNVFALDLSIRHSCS